MHSEIKKILSLFLAAVLILVPAVPAEAAGSSPMQYGTMEYYSTVNDGTITDSYHYSDDWFFSSSAGRNDDLALTSMQLIAASSDSSTEGLGIQFLQKLGFTDAAYVKNDTDDHAVCNYVHAKKQITNGTETAEVVAVVIQSYALDSQTKKLGWMQNFTVNTDPSHEEHGGFADAADQIIGEIRALSGSENTRYWIMGASRGGAIASLLSVRLKDSGAASEENLFTYTFESPAVVNGSAASSAGTNIHNYYTGDDIVTFVPPWGMTVYGNRYDLNTYEINAHLPEELSKIGSDLSQAAANANPENTIGMIGSILSVLESRIPTREEYSLVHSDTVLDGETETVLTYSYQDILVSLMNILFGMSTDGLDLSGLESHLSDLYGPVVSLASALKTENDQDYYDAASGLVQFLNDNGIGLPIGKTEMYGLLKLAGPLLVDADYVPEESESPDSTIAGYLLPIFSLVLGKDQLTFSHQFETIISRLKVLAPPLKLDDIAFTVEEPKAGDDPARITAELQAYLASEGMDFASMNGSWEISGETLPDNQVCYYTAELTAEAHEADANLSITVNGRAPIRPLSIQNTGSGCTVTGTWEFVIGAPSPVTVSFDAGGVKENPPTLTVPKGTKLLAVLDLDDSERVEKDGVILQCRGWADESGTPWKEISAENDLTLSCSWAEVVNYIETSFPIPAAGGAPTYPELINDIPCHIADVHLYDENYDEAESFEEGGSYTLAFYVLANDESCIFDAVLNEYGYEDYAGTALVNGEEVYYSYDPDLPGLYLSYEFTPGEKEEPVPQEHMHTLEFIPEKAASCTEDGNLAYYRCSECGKLFADAEGIVEISESAVAIKASGHEWGEWTPSNDPASASEGAKTRSCRKCGEAESFENTGSGATDNAAPGSGTAAIVSPAADGPSVRTEGSSKNSTAANTGDNSNVFQWVTRLAAAGAVLGMICLDMRRKRHN